jgi:hypothetical protein
MSGTDEIKTEATAAEPAEPEISETDVAPEDRDSGAMRALLQRATKKIESSHPAPDLLQGVQRKIRKRSRGKFFADGWSTANMRVSYALIAIVMLSIILIAYVALGPTGISR